MFIQTGIYSQDGYIIVIGSDDRDASIVEILVDAGYEVNRGLSHTGILSDEKLDSVNNADLVIFSRNGSTAPHGEDATVAEQWADVTAPILSLSPWIMRNNRWHWMNSSALGCFGSDSIYIPDNQQDHPIYTGIDVSSGLLEVLTPGKTRNEFFVLMDGDGNTYDEGNGDVLAMDPDQSGIIAAEWEENTEFYAGSLVPSSNRMWLGFVVEGDNCIVGDNIMSAFNGNADAETILLNAVAYMQGIDLTPPENIALNFAQELEIYPNPACDILTIKSLNNVIDYEIIGLTGAVIAKGVTLKNINVSELPSGLYVIRTSENTWARFIKK